MKVLVIGGGGREHAIVHTLKKSPKVDHIWCAPGNGGIAAEAECVPIKATDIDGMVAFAKEHKPDLVMVAPDDPLALGMVDALEAAGIRAFGPRKNAAIIEGSKSFAKDLMQKYNIPTAGYAVFENSADAIEYIRKNGAPIVVKADGLALGKGVTVAMTEEEAIEAVKEARAQGDLSENFEYHAAKKDKNQNESRIRYLERMIKTAKVISTDSAEDEVGMNNTVTVYFEEDDEEEVYKIVTTVRGNSLKNLISNESPLGLSLIHI